MAGNGKVVSITENHVDEMAAGYAGGRNVLIEKYDQTFNLVQTMKQNVDDYLAELNSSLTLISMPDGWQDIISDVVIDNVASIDFNEIPEPGTFSLPGFEDIVFPLAPVLKQAPDVDLTYTAPIAPSEVNASLGYVELPYTSSMWLDLFNKVHDTLVDGAEGFGGTVEDAIWQRAKDRLRDENEAAYNTATQNLSKRAVPFPQLSLIRIQQQMTAEIIRQRENLAFDIAAKQAELVYDTNKFFVEKGAELERLLRDFHINERRLSLEAKRAAAELLISNYAEQNRAYIARWQAITEELKTKVAVIEVVISENKALADLYRTSIDGALGETELIAKQRDSIVEGYKAEVDAYASKVRARSDWYNALTENQKAKLEKSRLELEQAVQEVKALLDSTLSINTLREKILDTIGGISAQVLASALNAVNTSIGHTTSASENRGEYWQHSDNLSDTYNTELEG